MVKMVRHGVGSNNFGPPDVQQEFGRGVTANQKATIRAFDKFYSMFPSFLDIFPGGDALCFVSKLLLLGQLTS